MSLALMNAVKANNLQEVKAILKDPEFDVNFRMKAPGLDGEITALHMAAAKGYTDIIRELLAHPKIQPNSLTSIGRTPLHAAAIYGQVEACKILLPVVNPIIRDKIKKLAYSVAKEKISQTKNSDEIKKLNEVLEILRVPTFVLGCEAGDLNCVKYMVEEKVNVDAKFNNSKALSTACVNQQIEVLDYLLSVPGINVNTQSEKGNTALHLITNCPHIYKKGSDISLREHIAKVLIKNGADVNKLNLDGESPLFLAVALNRMDLVKLFVENNADLKIKYSVTKYGKNYSLDIISLAEIRQDIQRYLKEVMFHRGEHSFTSAKQTISMMFSGKVTTETSDKPSNEIQLTA